MKRRLPKTLWGFPIEEDGESKASQHEVEAAVRASGDPDAPKKVVVRARERGIALIIAIMIISIMMLFSTDLILSSQVNMSLATAQRDNLKGEYMAKSGLNAGILLLAADMAYDLFMLQQNPKGGALSDGLGDFWAALNGLPIGGETLEMVTQFQESFGLNAVMESGVLDQLKLFDGAFIVDVQDESSKININFCAQSRCGATLAMLEALFSCPAEKQFLDQKKVTPKELAYRIKDWVDFDSKAAEETGYNDEDEPYRKREPQIRAKNAPMETLDELRLIEGWDEDIQAVFSPYLTVWPYQKNGQDQTRINVNTANRALLGCLFPESKGDCQEKSALALKGRNDDKAALGGDGKKMSDILRDTLCYNGGDSQNPDDSANKANWFSQASMTFRIEVLGNVGDSSRKLVAVVERQMPDPKKNEKSTYRILYWKLI